MWHRNLAILTALVRTACGGASTAAQTGSTIPPAATTPAPTTIPATAAPPATTPTPAPTPQAGEMTTGRTHHTATALVDGRANHTATLLSDDTVLVVGGVGNESPALVSAEIYDPGSGQ